VADLSRIGTNSSAHIVASKPSKNAMKCSIEAPARVKSDDPRDWAGAMFSPFFWVGTSSDAGACTMKMVHMKLTEFVVPVYENTRALKPDEPFIAFTPATAGFAAKKAKTQHLLQ
jgi:hypothetical protein